jgi:CheY-like chemotaxis protein
MPVLLVEDDRADAIIIKRAFNDLKVPNELVNKVDGEDALEYLRDQANKKPCIILLDLNMPRMNGFEFLKIVKADDVLKSIPVVVLTTSAEERDVVEGFGLGIAGYIVKPVSYAESVEAMKTLNMYWTLSRLPKGSTDRVVACSSAS